MWVGIEKGTFRKYGLDVRLVQMRNGSLSMATLSSGQVQYNYGSPGNALSAAVGGMKIQCVASPVQKIPRELVARKEIRTLEDLRGKTFGVQSIGGGFWLQTMIALDQLGIDPEKYDLKMRILGDTATVTQALGSGGVDATVIPYSFSEAAKRAGANVLADIGKLQFSLSGHDALLPAGVGRELARSNLALAQRIGRCRRVDSRSQRQAGYRRNPAQSFPLPQGGRCRSVLQSSHHHGNDRHDARSRRVEARAESDRQDQSQSRPSGTQSMLNPAAVRSLEDSGFLAEARKKLR